MMIVSSICVVEVWHQKQVSHTFVQTCVAGDIVWVTHLMNIAEQRRANRHIRQLRPGGYMGHIMQLNGPLAEQTHMQQGEFYAGNATY